MSIDFSTLLLTLFVEPSSESLWLVHPAQHQGTRPSHLATMNPKRNDIVQEVCFICR